MPWPSVAGSIVYLAMSWPRIGEKLQGAQVAGSVDDAFQRRRALRCPVLLVVFGRDLPTGHLKGLEATVGPALSLSERIDEQAERQRIDQQTADATLPSLGDERLPVGPVVSMPQERHDLLIIELVEAQHGDP